jgi:hypothetical protein
MASKPVLSMLALLLAFCTAVVGEEPKPACRMKKIILEPAFESQDNLTTCAEKEYYAQCNKAISKLDAKCQDACKNFKKRGKEQDPEGSGQCKADPVEASGPEFRPEFCRPDQNHSNHFVVSCTVSAECTCDP